MLGLKEQLGSLKKITGVTYISNTKEYRVTYCLGGAEFVQMKNHLTREEIEWCKTGAVKRVPRIYLGI